MEVTDLTFEEIEQIRKDAPQYKALKINKKERSLSSNASAPTSRKAQ